MLHQQKRRDEAGESGDKGAERKRGPRAKMSKTAGDGEESEGWCRAAQDEGGMTEMGGLREKCSLFFFLLKVG